MCTKTLNSVKILYFTMSNYFLHVTLFTRGDFMAFGGVPSWFFAIAFAFAIIFILVSEWNSRR